MIRGNPTCPDARPPQRAARVWIRALAFLLVAPLAADGADAGKPAPVWLAVGRPQLVAALKPLVEQRRKEGLEAVVSTATVEAALAAAPRRPRYLLLVGDDEPGKDAEPWYLPARERPLYRWQADQPEHFASDAAWGLRGDEPVPDIAVGRIPARTPHEVELVVQKILEFERQQPTTQDLQLLIWAGSPQYSPQIDTWATGLLVVSTLSGAPAWAAPWMLSADPAQPLCGWPPDQPQQFCRRMRLGGVCQVLMGHGSEQSFFSMVHEGRSIELTGANAGPALAGGPPTPPLIMLACSTGKFTDATPCLTESLLFMSGGPVAAVGATTFSHPWPNYLVGQSLLWALGQPEERLGDFWLAAQGHACDAASPLVEHVLLEAEGKLEEHVNEPRLRRDGCLMYALLGDPATRLRMPQPLRAKLDAAGPPWRWTVERPADATRLEMEFQEAGRPALRAGAPEAGREAANAALERANACFAFQPLASLSAEQPWAGTVQKPGKLRLVATGPGKLYVAVLELPAVP